MNTTRWELMVILDSCGSTNDRAFERLQKGCRTVAVMARKMERGRGRAGHVWVAPPGGLWLSVGWSELPVEEALLLSFYAPLVVVEVLEGLGLSPRIRIPNDVYLSGRKVAGVLVERRNTHTVLGIGVNITNRLPKDLEQKACRLADFGVTLPPLHLAYAFLERLSLLLPHLHDSGLLEAWKNRMDEVRAFRGYISGQPVAGKVLDVLSPHALKVVFPDGRAEEVPLHLLHDLVWEE